MRLRDFAGVHGVQWRLQPKGPDSVHPLDPPDDARLAYALPEFGVVVPFLGAPTSPRSITRSTRRWSAPARCGSSTRAPEERVIDWFCGLGPPRSPIRDPRGSVLGARAEGSEALVARGRATTRRSTGSPGAPPASSRTTCSNWRRPTSRATRARLRSGWSTRRARARSRWPWLSPTPLSRTLRWRPAVPEPPGRIVYVKLQPGHAGARRRAAGAPGGLPLHGRRGGQHVPAHGARREHRRVRARSVGSSAEPPGAAGSSRTGNVDGVPGNRRMPAARQAPPSAVSASPMKKAPFQAGPSSRDGPGTPIRARRRTRPSRLSRLWKTL